MPLIDRKNVLRGIMVSEAMRKLVVELPEDAPLVQAARFSIKFKVNAILVTDGNHRAMGVVSKTDLAGAYYADLPIESPVRDVMVGPPLFCRADDSLETALEAMHSHAVHRLYVLGKEPNIVAGVLAYPDIVGLLYRFCSKCERSIARSGSRESKQDIGDRYKVGDVMTGSVMAHREDASLTEIMEGLSAHRLGAVLIRGDDDFPVGVVSKTDLLIAYMHGIPQSAEAKAVMTSPLRSCDRNQPLSEAIRMMIFSDIHRLFVYRDHSFNIVGVLSLTDAARVRSGSCRACLASRIESRMTQDRG